MGRLFSKIINYLKYKLLKNNIVSVGVGSKRALLYYKTDIFVEKNKSNIY